MIAFKNHQLSFSRLSAFEQCPLYFRFRYIDRLKPEPTAAQRLGKVIHSVIERLVRKAVDEERASVLERDYKILYHEAWIEEGLAGFELFQEGLEILGRFIRDQGVIEHRNILEVGRGFYLPAGPFIVLGDIDRVDHVEGQTVEIISYKFNQKLFTEDELETDLQMSLCELAVRRIWPSTKKVKLTFWMLRHGVRQETSRTPEQLEAALAYAETLGYQTETATEFPPRLNTNCSCCEHRSRCPAYADSLRGAREFVVDPSTLPAAPHPDRPLALASNKPVCSTIEPFAECTHASEVVLKPPRRPCVTASLRRKRAYVCHPFADLDGDGIASLCDITRDIIDRGDVPIAPQLFLHGIVDEQAEPDLALSLHLELVALSDEVHVYGPTITARMKKVIDCALELGIAIRFMELAS